MKSTNKPETYEAIRTRMVFPVVPIPAEGELPARSARGKGPRSVNLKQLPIQGLSTLPGSVGKAERQADALLKHGRQRVRRGDTTAIIDLLEANPAFILDAWVREKLLQFWRSGRLRRKHRRPRGRFLAHPLVVVGLVEECLARGLAKNRYKAFAKVAEWVAFLSRDRVKQLFYQAWREERFRAILLKFPEFAQPVTVEEMTGRLRNAESLRPGSKITQTMKHPQLGPVEITFEAK